MDQKVVRKLEKKGRSHRRGHHISNGLKKLPYLPPRHVMEMMASSGGSSQACNVSIDHISMKYFSLLER